MSPVDNFKLLSRWHWPQRWQEMHMTGSWGQVGAGSNTRTTGLGLDGRVQGDSKGVDRNGRLYLRWWSFGSWTYTSIRISSLREHLHSVFGSLNLNCPHKTLTWPPGYLHKESSALILLPPDEGHRSDHKCPAFQPCAPCFPPLSLSLRVQDPDRRDQVPSWVSMNAATLLLGSSVEKKESRKAYFMPKFRLFLIAGKLRP